jgi:hypothetical protein
VDIFENAFRKIKEATGVSDVNEVILKITSQEATTENLITVTRENQGKIEALNQLRKQIKAHCEEIKYSGVGGGQHRKMVDSFEDQLANSVTRLDRARLKYERLSKIAISMKAGVGHLQDKLESFREETNGSSFVMSDETITEVLRECEICFTQLTKRIKAGEDEARRAQITDTSDGGTSEEKPSSLSQQGTTTVPRTPTGIPKTSTGKLTGNSSRGMFQRNNVREVVDIDETASRLNTLRPFNQRIDLNWVEESFTAGVYTNYEVGPDEATIGDLEDDELTRDKVKRASSQILIAMEKRKKKPKGKKGAQGGGALGEDDKSMGSHGNNKG